MATSSDSDDDQNRKIKARGYQTTLSQIASKENIIVVLPTGTGKTLIASMVIDKLAFQIRPPFEDGGMRTFFLVPYKVLVEQQASEIAKCTDFKNSEVGRFTGDMNVDFWSKSDWTARFVKYKILVMTAQIFKDIIDKDYLSPSRVNLIIFDECHHAAMKKKGKDTNDVYKLIMTSMKQRGPLQTRILGLTASVINNKADAAKIDTLVRDLEATYSAKCMSAEPEEVLQFKTNALQVIWKCPPNFGAHKTVPVISIIKDIIKDLDPKFAEWEKNKTLRKLPIDFKDVKSSLNNISLCAEEFGTWLAMKACEMYCNELVQQSSMFENTMPEFADLLLFLANFIGWCKRLLEHLIMIHHAFLSPVNVMEVSCLRLVSPKLLRLLQVLENYSSGPHKLKGIIFVEKRFDAKVLSLWLNEVSKLVPSLSFLRAGYLIGYSNRPGLTSKLVAKSKSEQDQTIERFKMGQDKEEFLNILVATNVLEEGLNITDCNLIVRFHPPITFKSWIQSMGRARADDARYVLMPVVGKEYELLMKTLKEFRETYQALNAYCLRRKLETEGRLMPPSNEEDSRDKNILESQIVRSRRENCTASIDAAKAISTINCYCQQLDTDWPSQPTNDPHQKIGNRFIHGVRLPMTAMYTGLVVGHPMSNSKLAKKSAYLALCQRLYDAGGLDDYLQPVRKKELIRRAIAKLDVEIPEEVVSNDCPKPGTSKRKQVYKKLVHPCLQNGNQEKWFLYRIIISEDQTVHLKNIEESYDPLKKSAEIVEKRCFGFLTKTEIPLGSINTSFPVFRQNWIKMDVSIEFVASDIRLSQEEEIKLVDFHKYLFNEVLGFRAARFKYQEGSGLAPATNYLVVPVDLTLNIDMNFVDEVQKKRIQPDLIRNEDNNPIRRNDFVFKDHDYQDCLVMRWYNHADNQIFKIEVDEKAEEHTKTLFTGAFHVLKVKKPCTGCDKCDCRNCRDCGRCGKCPQCKRCSNCKQCQGLYPTSDFPFKQRDGKDFEIWQSNPKTYREYYSLKYGILINDLDQPLLEVDYTEKLATPHIPLQMKGAKLFKRIQHFVPELCVICPIPVSLWEDAVCLPSVFYRLNELLLASSFLASLGNKLQMKINNNVQTSLKWGSSVARFVERRMNPVEFGSGQPCLVEFLDLDACDRDINDNWDLPEDNFISDDDSDSESMEEGDSGDDVVTDAVSRGAASNSIPDDEMNERECNLDKILDVEVKSNTLFSDVCLEPLVKLENIKGELTNPSLNERIEKETKDHIENISTALQGIATNANNVMFNDDVEMEDKDNFIMPRRNLDSFKEMPPFKLREKDAKLTAEMILEAITCKSAQDYLNMERYETIGDSFLKLATIEYFHSKDSRLPEGSLTYIKSKHVSNYNLYRLASKIDLGNRMHVQRFHGHVTWNPPGFHLIPKNDTDVDNVTCHHVADKQVADCVEALIGMFLINLGCIEAVKFMSYLGLRVTDLSLNDLCSIDQHWIRTKLFPYNHDGGNQMTSRIWELYSRSSLSSIEEILGYCFNDKGWLLMAYTHPSNVDNDVTGCYQRLEFLGDAVLDFLITRYLFQQKTLDKKVYARHFDPGELTDLRSALVNNVFFGCILIKYQLHKSFMASPELRSQINTIAELFIQKFDDNNKTRKYLDKVLGFYVVQGIQEDEESFPEMPKILGDIFEALFGAIYLDSGRDLNCVWKILYSLISEQLRDFCIKIPRNPVQQVYLNDASAKFHKPTVNEAAETKKVDVSIKLRYLGGNFEGFGKNKKFAKIDAARKAIWEHEKKLEEKSSNHHPN